MIADCRDRHVISYWRRFERSLLIFVIYMTDQGEKTVVKRSTSKKAKEIVRVLFAPGERAEGNRTSPQLPRDITPDDRERIVHKEESEKEKKEEKEARKDDPSLSDQFPVGLPDLLYTAQAEISTLLGQQRRLELILEQLRAYGEARTVQSYHGLPYLFYWPTPLCDSQALSFY